MRGSILYALKASLLINSALAGRSAYNMTHNGVEVPVTVTEVLWSDRKGHFNRITSVSARGNVITRDDWAGTQWPRPPSGFFGTITGKFNVPGIYIPPGAGSGPNDIVDYY